MNILLTGAAGQLGSELRPLLSAHGNLTATDRNKPVSATGNWQEFDIGDGAKLEALLNRSQPRLIVNTAAYTAVDQAEANRETAFNINAELPSRLAVWAKRNDARLLHYSTDYVFDGQATRPYLETDAPNPQNIYGESKLAGERALETVVCKHVTLRTSWVYSSHGKNFVLSMIDLARRGLTLRVVDDQHGCPTWARNLAHASVAVIEAWQANGSAGGSGVFHYCDDRSLCWYDFACTIFDLAVRAGLLDRVPVLTPVPSSEFPQPAARPKWSVLDTGRIKETFNILPASFEDSLQTVIDEIKARA
ncbi:MAG TPA: dTDP-4-dehydrorhamnose reductase [Xanthomonadales bacterium]